MKKHIETLQRKYLVDGIVSDIEMSVKEKERETFLGSTDRKAYTVQFRARWLDEELESYVEIQPWQEEVPDLLKRIQDESKYKFAINIYEKYFKN